MAVLNNFNVMTIKISVINNRLVLSFLSISLFYLMQFKYV